MTKKEIHKIAVTAVAESLRRIHQPRLATLPESETLDEFDSEMRRLLSEIERKIAHARENESG